MCIGGGPGPFLFRETIDSKTISNWESLTEYVGNAVSQPQASQRVIEERHIDNNGVQNAIRPTAIGRKNWLFFGDAEPGQLNAITHKIIESCRRRGIDPYAYLSDVLTRVTESTNWNVADLIP